MHSCNFLLSSTLSIAIIQCLVIDGLPDDLDLAEAIAGLACDGIDGAHLHLLLDAVVEGEERLPGALRQEVVEQERQPVAHHLLSHRLIPEVKLKTQYTHSKEIKNMDLMG